MAVRSGNSAAERDQHSPADTATASGRPVGRCHRVRRYRRGLVISARRTPCSRQRAKGPAWTAPLRHLASFRSRIRPHVGCGSHWAWWWRRHRFGHRVLALACPKGGSVSAQFERGLQCHASTTRPPVTVAPWDLTGWPASRRRPGSRSCMDVGGLSLAVIAVETSRMLPTWLRRWQPVTTSGRMRSRI